MDDRAVERALEILYREYEDAMESVGRWEQLRLLDQDTDRALVRMSETKEQQIKRADWGRQRKPVTCVPCIEGKHRLCVRPCVCRVRVSDGSMTS